MSSAECPSKMVALTLTAKPRALLAHRFIVVLLEAIEVYGEEQVGRRLELIELLFEQQRVGAQRHELLARHDALDDRADVLVDERFAARNGDHRGTAFVDRRQAFLDRKPAIENRIRVVDLAAADAGEVAAEQRF